MKLRRRVLRRRRRRAGVPRCEGDTRNFRDATWRVRAARRRAVGDPVHGRRRRGVARGRGRAARRRRRRGGASAFFVGAPAARSTSRGSPSGSARRPYVVAVDAEGGRVRWRAGTTATARAHHRLSGRARLNSAWRGRDPADVDQHRRHARGLRPAAQGPVSPQRCGVPVMASGGAGGAGHVEEALGIAQAALLAWILHEISMRGLSSLRAELRALGVEGAQCRVSWRRRSCRLGDGPGADARLDERGGAAPHARDGRGVVLESLPRAAQTQGRDLGQLA